MTLTLDSDLDAPRAHSDTCAESPDGYHCEHWPTFNCCFCKGNDPDAIRATPCVGMMDGGELSKPRILVPEGARQFSVDSEAEFSPAL